MLKSIIVLLSIVLLIASTSLAADKMHKMEFLGGSPVLVPEEFPQTIENGVFMFRGLAELSIKGIDVILVEGISSADPEYQLLLLFIVGGEKIQLIAAGTGKTRGPIASGAQFYRDEQFFTTGKISGMLTRTPEFPSPADIEKVIFTPIQKLRSLPKVRL